MKLKLLKWFGILWLFVAALFIIANYISIWYFEGFGRLTEILSPFNVLNYIAVLVTLAPGLAALAWHHKKTNPS